MRDVDTCSIQELQDILAKKQEDETRMTISFLTNEDLLRSFERVLYKEAINADDDYRTGLERKGYTRVCYHRDELLKRLNSDECEVVLPLTSEVTEIHTVDEFPCA